MIQWHEQTRAALPGRRGRLNIYAIAKLAGYSRGVVEAHREQLEQLANALGFTAGATLNPDPQARLGDRPWLPSIVGSPGEPNSLDVTARMTQTACYVVVAFLSGMRDSEIKSLRRGCLRVVRDETGRPYRWRVSGRAFKDEHDPAGAPATWVVGAPVADAVEVLQRLQPPGTDLLFTALPHSCGRGPASAGRNVVLQAKTTNRQLADYVAWINALCAAHGREDSIPTGHRITTRQFRRTLAWFIARQPGGAIAGAIQYRHLSVQMFEGYAGTTASGFRAEVEAEQALLRGEGYLQQIDGHLHEWTGPAAGEAVMRIGQFTARFPGRVIADRNQFLRVLRRHDPAVFPGHHVTCVFDPAKARCLHGADAADGGPAFDRCQPLTCRNVALTADNRAALTAELNACRRHLTPPEALPPLLAERVRRRAAGLADLLEDKEETRDDG